MKLFSFFKKQPSFSTIYYKAYGMGAHAHVLGYYKSMNPYEYGTLEHDAWNDGYELRK